MSSSAVYELSYFNGRGLAEGIRLVFAAANVAFKDNRLDDTTWPAYKPTTLFGKMPELIVKENGHTERLYESRSIERFLAARFGLFGANEYEHQRIDMVTDALADLRHQAYLTKDDAEKKAKFLSEGLPATFSALNKAAQQYGSAGHFVGNKISLAECKLRHVFENLPQDVIEKLLAANPNIKAIHENFNNTPSVKKWLDTRPKSEW